ncbi:hypothetical protein JCM14469_22600 [Desulfatiferula olefinivorans]
MIMSLVEPTASGSPGIIAPLWELFPNFRCPVIGACLTVGEQAAILKKSGHDPRTLTDYQIHHTLMEALDSDNPTSRRADRFIRHKHRRAIARYGVLGPAELENAWAPACASGEIEGLFFTICARSDVGQSLKVKAFGDLHMLCHTNMTDILRARRKIDDQIHVNRRLAALLNREKKKCGDVTRQLRQARKDLDDQARRQNRPAPPPHPKYPAPDYRDDALKILKADLARAEEEKRHLERQKRTLEIRSFELESDNRLLSEEVRRLICPRADDSKTPGDEPACCRDCTHCPRRVLMVGGITKLEPFYRNLVEASGHEFIYHDGYMKSGTRKIDDMVAQADLVLCPVNCNSHNACRTIKRLCKKYDTNCKMLPGSSLSMITKALTDRIPADLTSAN